MARKKTVKEEQPDVEAAPIEEPKPVPKKKEPECDKLRAALAFLLACGGRSFPADIPYWEEIGEAAKDSQYVQVLYSGKVEIMRGGMQYLHAGHD